MESHALADEILRAHLVVERMERPRDNQRLNLGNQLAVLTLNTAWLAMSAEEKKAWLLKRLELPPALGALESGRTEGSAHLAELVRAMVAREVWMPAPLVARVLVRAAEALGVGPRFHPEVGLSARNIWVDHDGRVWVAACEAMVHPSAAPSLLGNLAPERLEGAAVNACSDVFSLGVVLYWMLTGLKPFAGRTVMELADAVRLSELEPPSQVADSPPSLDAVVLRALARRPDRRYPTPALFAQALEGRLQNFGEPASDGDVAVFVSRLLAPAGL